MLFPSEEITPPGMAAEIRPGTRAYRSSSPVKLVISERSLRRSTE